MREECPDIDQPSPSPDQGRVRVMRKAVSALSVLVIVALMALSFAAGLLAGALTGSGTCGPGERSAVTNEDVQPMGYCRFLDPGAGTVPSTGDVVISGNVIRDSNSDGMTLIHDLGVKATATVTNNVIRDLSQRLPEPGRANDQRTWMRRSASTAGRRGSRASRACRGRPGSRTPPARGCTPPPPARRSGPR